MKQRWITFALMAAAVSLCLGQAPAPYQNPNLPPERRAADLVGRMTLEEKVLQMQNSAPAIPRLGVPVYNWWNEALHGVASGRYVHPSQDAVMNIFTRMQMPKELPNKTQ